MCTHALSLVVLRSVGNSSCHAGFDPTRLTRQPELYTIINQVETHNTNTTRLTRLVTLHNMIKLIRRADLTRPYFFKDFFSFIYFF
jgi:hypothetical protein